MGEENEGPIKVVGVDPQALLAGIISKSNEKPHPGVDRLKSIMKKFAQVPDMIREVIDDYIDLHGIKNSVDNAAGYATNLAKTVGSSLTSGCQNLMKLFEDELTLAMSKLSKTASQQPDLSR